MEKQSRWKALWNFTKGILTISAILAFGFRFIVNRLSPDEPSHY